MPTVEQIVAELKIRIEANRKLAESSAKWDWEKQQHICERTAQELERLLFWIEGK